MRAIGTVRGALVGPRGSRIAIVVGPKGFGGCRPCRKATRLRPARTNRRSTSSVTFRLGRPTPSEQLQAVDQPCWIAESTQASRPPEGRTNVQSSVTVCGIVALPPTTRPLPRSTITSISENFIATVAYSARAFAPCLSEIALQQFHVGESVDHALTIVAGEFFREMRSPFQASPDAAGRSDPPRCRRPGFRPGAARRLRNPRDRW